MTRDMYLVLVVLGPAHERRALSLVLSMLARVRPDTSVRCAVVDNSRDDNVEREIGRGIHRIGGDNTLHEFSAWDRGLDWLRWRYAPAPESIVVLTNDTVVRSEKHDRVRDIPADRLRSADRGALVGWVEEYPRSVALFGLTMRQWVDTSLVIAQRRVLDALGPLARPFDQDVFTDDWRRFFREPSPLSENYRTYLRTYFFGEQLDEDFRHGWYAQEPLTERNADAFKTKLRCVFCEHLLSARARARGIPLVDIRPTARPIDPSRASALDVVRASL